MKRFPLEVWNPENEFPQAYEDDMPVLDSGPIQNGNVFPNAYTTLGSFIPPKTITKHR